MAVSIDGHENVLRAIDPNPLRRGLFGLGVIANSGYVLYDDVTLISVDTADEGELRAKATNWP